MSVPGRPDGSLHVTVLGATGYISGRLVPALLDAGHRVRCVARTPSKLDVRPWRDDVEVARGDLLEPDTLDAALAGTDIVYYLVHSLGVQEGFEELERRSATNVAHAAATHDVRQIVYLAGARSRRRPALAPPAQPSRGRSPPRRRLDLMQIYGERTGLRGRLVVRVPVLTPRLSAGRVNLVTSVPGPIASQLVEGLQNDVVVTDRPLDDVMDLPVMGVREAIDAAVSAVQDLDIPTRWTPPLTARYSQPSEWDPDWAGGTVLTDVRTARFVPSGLWGRAYWAALEPCHALVFGRMVRRLAERAERPGDDDGATGAEPHPALAMTMADHQRS